MKKILILSMAAFLIFGFASMAKAALTDPLELNNVTAAYYVVNSESGKPADISVVVRNYFFGNNVLEYKSSGDWVTLPSSRSLSFTVEDVIDKQLVQFRLLIEGSKDNVITTVEGSKDNVITTADMFFDSLKAGSILPLYRSVTIDFYSTGSGVSFGTIADPHYATPVPLPGAAWLLGSGILGLAIVRRRWMV